MHKSHWVFPVSVSIWNGVLGGAFLSTSYHHGRDQRQSLTDALSLSCSNPQPKHIQWSFVWWINLNSGCQSDTFDFKWISGYKGETWVQAVSQTLRTVNGSRDTQDKLEFRLSQTLLTVKVSQIHSGFCVSDNLGMRLEHGGKKYFSSF